MERIKDVDFVPGRTEVSAGCLQPVDLKTDCTISATNPDTTNDLAGRAPSLPTGALITAPLSLPLPFFFFPFPFIPPFHQTQLQKVGALKSWPLCPAFHLLRGSGGCLRTPCSLLRKYAQGYGNQSSGRLFGTRRCNTFCCIFVCVSKALYYIHFRIFVASSCTPLKQSHMINDQKAAYLALC